MILAAGDCVALLIALLLRGCCDDIRTVCVTGL